MSVSRIISRQFSDASTSTSRRAVALGQRPLTFGQYPTPPRTVIQAYLELDTGATYRMNWFRWHATSKHREPPRLHTRIPLFLRMPTEQKDLYLEIAARLAQRPRIPLGWSFPIPVMQQHYYFYSINLPVPRAAIPKKFWAELANCWPPYTAEGTDTVAVATNMEEKPDGSNFQHSIPILRNLSLREAEEHLRKMMKSFPTGVELGYATGISVFEKTLNRVDSISPRLRRGFVDGEIPEPVLLGEFKFQFSSRREWSLRLNTT